MRNKNILFITPVKYFAVFILITLLLPSLRDDLNPISSPISHYLRGSYGWLAVVSFMALGLGAALLLFLLNKSHKQNKLVLTLLNLYALGVIVAGVTHPDSTIHGVGAFLAFSTVPLMVVSARQKHWLAWFIVITSSFVLWLILPFGLAERITTFLEVAWLIYFTRTAFYSRGE